MTLPNGFSSCELNPSPQIMDLIQRFFIPHHQVYNFPHLSHYPIEISPRNGVLSPYVFDPLCGLRYLGQKSRSSSCIEGSFPNIIKRKFTPIQVVLIDRSSLCKLRQEIERIRIILKSLCKIPDGTSQDRRVPAMLDRVRSTMEFALTLAYVVGPPSRFLGAWTATLPFRRSTYRKSVRERVPF